MSGNVVNLIDHTPLWDYILNTIDVWTGKVRSISTHPLQGFLSGVAGWEEDIIRRAEEDLSACRRGEESGNWESTEDSHGVDDDQTQRRGNASERSESGMEIKRKG
jgi:hypothetical protein